MSSTAPGAPARAFAMFTRLPFFTLSCRFDSMSAEPISLALSSLAPMSSNDSTEAATPVTYAADMDVPAWVPYASPGSAE